MLELMRKEVGVRVVGILRGRGGGFLSVREGEDGFGGLMREGRSVVSVRKLEMRGRRVGRWEGAEVGLGWEQLVAENGRGLIVGLDLIVRERVRVGLVGRVGLGECLSSFRTVGVISVPLPLPLRLSHLPTVRHQLHSLEGESDPT